MNSAWLVVAFAFGAALGAFYFGGLWITVRRLAHTPQPEFLVFASFLLRVGVVLSGFYLVMDGRWERLAACMAGFLLARTTLVHWLRDIKNDAGRQATSVRPKRTAK